MENLKMKKFKKTSVMLSLILCISILLSGNVFAYTEIPNNQKNPLEYDLFDFNKEEVKRLNKVFEDKFKETVLTANLNVSITVDKIKEAQDFSGNRYLIIEGKPEGYMIYNVNTGTFCERSPKGKSPYYEKDGNLYYGGLTYYYQKQGDKYYNLKEKEEILNESDIDTYGLVQQSEKLQQYYIESPKNEIINFINKGDTIEYKALHQKNIKEIEYENYEKTLEENQLVRSARYFSYYDWFSNLNDCGFISGGKCGYIALAMVYAAHDISDNNNLVDDDCFTGYSKTGLNQTLATQMYNLAPKSSTTSIHIEKVSKLYAATRSGVSVSHENWVAPAANWNSVTKKMNGTGEPVIIFGNLNNEGGHAVVGYYTPPAKNYIVCHMGWNDQPYVLWEGVIGSYYYMKVN